MGRERGAVYIHICYIINMYTSILRIIQLQVDTMCAGYLDLVMFLREKKWLLAPEAEAVRRKELGTQKWLLFLGWGGGVWVVWVVVAFLKKNGNDFLRHEGVLLYIEMNTRTLAVKVFPVNFYICVFGEFGFVYGLLMLPSIWSVSSSLQSRVELKL